MPAWKMWRKPWKNEESLFSHASTLGLRENRELDYAPLARFICFNSCTRIAAGPRIGKCIR